MRVRAAENRRIDPRRLVPSPRSWRTAPRRRPSTRAWLQFAPTVARCDLCPGELDQHSDSDHFWISKAAAFARSARSSIRRWFCNRSRDSSSRSVFVSPPSSSLSARSACLAQCRIDHDETPNSLPSSLHPRPARNSSTMRCRNSGVYLFHNLGVSVLVHGVPEAGQIQVGMAAP